MSDLFNSLDYRDLCYSLASELKKKSPHWTSQKIAEKIPVHGPYLSNVFNKKAHFSVDQLFEFSNIVKLNPHETEYLLLLADWERCASQTRKADLKKRIEKIRQKSKLTEEHLQQQVMSHSDDVEARYFLNPDLFLVSTFLGIDKYAQKPALIAAALKVSEKQIAAWVDELVNMDFFKRSKTDELSPGKRAKSFHLSKKSPYCDPHILLMMLRGQQHQRSIRPEENYAFSLTFTGSQEAREALHSEFLKFLKRAEQIVKDAPSQEVFQMNFNLFPWS